MITIINCGSSKTHEILKTVNSFDKEAQVVNLNQLDYGVLAISSGIIISGAPILLTEINPLPYLQQFSFLKNFEKPVLGICFGHQIMGMVYGAKISLCAEDRNWQEINVLSHTKLINKGKYMFKEDHCECINLPEAFSLLAKSNVCDNEAMKHKEKNQYGVQFHPEVSGEKGKLILENFTKFCLS